MSDAPVEALVSLPPGETITRLILAVSVDRTGGVPVAPRVTASGTRLPLPARLLRGQGELVVTVRGESTVVRLEAQPPPWPFRIGWERRTLRRLLGPSLVSWSSPSSAG
jgi:hypothetical protein